MKRWMAAGVVATTIAGSMVLSGSQASARVDKFHAVLRAPSGVKVGHVDFRITRHSMVVRAVLRPNRYVSAGNFHGFHIHANNDAANGSGCIANASQLSSTWFVSADGHLSYAGQTHGQHAGDMPSPLVLSNGRATLRFKTDRIAPQILRGKAVVLHAGPDNFGNVPTGTGAEQYTANSSAATEKTGKTGNSGDRVACGIVRRNR